MFNQVLNFNQNRTLSNGMPNMANTLTGWEVPLTLIKITQSIVDGDVVFNETKTQFMGVLQPLRTEDLISKPEGQRSWDYYWIHTKDTLPFQTADKIEYSNVRYKITAIKNYGLNGFTELEVILDYQ